MPPSGFSKRAVEGALVFIQTCYQDLLEETRSGKHATFEEAIEFEIRQLELALSKLHINQEGKIVER